MVIYHILFDHDCWNVDSEFIAALLVSPILFAQQLWFEHIVPGLSQ